MTEENPTRVQPNRNVVSYKQILPDSESSSSPESDKEDSEYVPPVNKGKNFVKYILSEYLARMLICM